MNITINAYTKRLASLIIVSLVFSVFVLNTSSVFAEEEIDMNAVSALIDEIDGVLASSPAPPEGVDTKEALRAADELGILEGSEGEFVVVDETGSTADTSVKNTTASRDDNLTDAEDKTEDSDAIYTTKEQKSNQKIMSLGEGGPDSKPKKEVAGRNDVQAQGTGSPGMFFWQNVQPISAQECMRRARDAFESEGMTIGNGDYWWYGAYEPRFHSYNNCLDIGNGYTIVNFTSASWRMDTLDHLNRLISAYNSPPGTLSKKTPYSGDVPRRIPELYMWVQMKNLSQPECIKRATAALKSEGLNITGVDVSWVLGQDGRFNTYVACTDIGNGNVYVNVTSTSSQSEDIEGHRNRIMSKFD